MKVDLRASMSGQRARRSLFSPSLPAGKLAVAVLLLLCAANAGTFLQFRAAAAGIAERQSALAAQKTASVAQEKENAALRAKVERYGEGVAFMRAGGAVYEFIAAVSEIAVEQAVLFSFRCDGKQVSLTGEAANKRAVLDFAERVGLLVCVASAELPEIDGAQVGESAGAVRFSLRCALR